MERLGWGMLRERRTLGGVVRAWSGDEEVCVCVLDRSGGARLLVVGLRLFAN